ncbi:tripartite tricarboxylate transporter TctB family protein [Jannaschia formosa]|uniref:tripartite tricarboxylate transporter TctB family protein n=1 Tax=Jannaschia formosa TaxID=2259592 RepID=UPI000E1C0036|nr:tripartite tricarboxylate transporter TctB family protein [Jannaschia formosa]TFL16050.1 hypothetical protein DR046_22035 [Jannaschia formosa]
MTAPAPTGGRPSRRPLWRFAVAALLLAAAAVLLIHSFDPRYSRGMYETAPRAMILPRGLLIAWGGMAAAAMAAEWLRPAPSDRDGTGTALWLAGVFLAGAIALPFAGFALTIAPVTFAALVVLGERRPLVLLAATALLGPGLWALFHHVLLIRLPSILPGGLL